MNTNFSLPARVISYYASTKSPVDGTHSYNYWMRSKLVRIVANKPFGRGDVLLANSITTTSSGITINCEVEEEWAEEYPLLCFVSGRLIYNKWASFEFNASEGIQIISPIEQILSDNYSFGLILAVYKSGKITCTDTTSGNNVDIFVGIEWE